MTRNPDLEAAMRADRDDPGPSTVYADWLQARGAPAGELMALQRAVASAPDAATQQRIDALVAQLGLPPPNLATWGWKHGRWEWLRLENDVDWMDDGFDPLGLVERLFPQPFCAALDELRIGVLRWEHNYHDVPAVLAAAAGHGWADALVRLHLGDVSPDIDMAHHVIGDVGAAISHAFPALEELRLHSGAQAWRGDGETFGVTGLDLPALRTLIVETCAMTSERLAALFAARLPALTRLELWFGSPDQDATATIDDLAPLLAGAVFPRVTHLALANSQLAEQLVDRLAESPIAARLVALDLSKSTLDDASAHRLAATAARYPALRSMNVDDNYLGDEVLRALREAFPRVEVVSHDQSKRQYEADGRYASVGE